MIPSVRTLCFLLFVLGACAHDPAPSGRLIHHPNGLTMVLPEGFVVTNSPDGFELVPRNEVSARSPTMLSLTYVAGSRQPGGEWSRRNVAGEDVYVDVREIGSGSGGTIHEWRAWKLLGTGYVLVKQTTQAEPPEEPDVAIAVNLVASATVSGQAR